MTYSPCSLYDPLHKKNVYFCYSQDWPEDESCRRICWTECGQLEGLYSLAVRCAWIHIPDISAIGMEALMRSTLNYWLSKKFKNTDEMTREFIIERFSLVLRTKLSNQYDVLKSLILQ
jgi:hypothetical protein